LEIIFLFAGGIYAKAFAGWLAVWLACSLVWLACSLVGWLAVWSAGFLRCFSQNVFVNRPMLITLTRWGHRPKNKKSLGNLYKTPK